jgi:long-chain acyl-CoA synthetase
VERIWLKEYPPGVPADIDPDEYASVREIFEETCRKHATRPAFSCMGRTLTFEDLDALSAAFAAWLQGMGCRKGARVALMMPNILQYPVCVFGALRAGCTVVNCNPLYTARELEHQLVDSGAEVLVVLRNFAHVAAEVLPRTGVRHAVVTTIGGMLGVRGRVIDAVLNHRLRRELRRLGRQPLVARLLSHRARAQGPSSRLPGAVRFTDALRDGRKRGVERREIGPADIAFLQYTGGTTGVAKGAMLTHRNIVANLMQARAWVNPFLGEERQVIITPLPLYHILSLTANCLVFMTLGGENVLIPNPRDIPRLVREMGRYRFTAITGVNTLFNALLGNPDFARLDFTALRIALGGGTAVHEAVARRWKEVTRCTLVEAYGLTETSPAATINPFDLPAWNGSIGLPISSTDIEIRDDAEQPVPLGSPGELCIKGPQVMAGYWNRPEETAKVMTRDGYLKTGDIGVMDTRGYIRLIDRKKDLILVSGFNVYPNEIEAVVAEMPGVLECAAVGVPDARTGEAVKLYVVRRDPMLTAEAVIAHCRANLTNYKCPHSVEFRSELPKSNVGKILRRELRDAPSRTAVPA